MSDKELPPSPPSKPPPPPLPPRRNPTPPDDDNLPPQYDPPPPPASIPIVAPSHMQDMPDFDFDDFLQKLRAPDCISVQRYLRSFLREFKKRPYLPVDQSRIVADFLDFLVPKLPTITETWSRATEDDLDRAREGIEKVVTGKLYAVLFSPVDDLKRDKELARKIKLFAWLQPKHLDIGVQSVTFLEIAQHELNLMSSFRAPRDKLLCIVNACKVIMAFMEKVDAGADVFLPMLIWTLVQVNPPKLVSNCMYVERFRYERKLHGEAGYHLTNMISAITFIENMDHSKLTIEKDEYDRLLQEAELTIGEEEPSPPPEPVQSPASPPGRPSSIITSRLPSAGTAVQEGLSGILNAFSRFLFEPSPEDVSSPDNSVKTSETSWPRSGSVSRRAERATFVTSDSGGLRRTRPLSSTFTSRPTTLASENILRESRFEASLTKEERDLLDDYEMQLALALSLSQQSEQVLAPETILANDEVQAETTRTMSAADSLLDLQSDNHQLIQLDDHDTTVLSPVRSEASDKRTPNLMDDDVPPM